MKAGLLLLAGFSAGVVAQPQNHRRFHNKRHEERQAVVYKTDVVVVTAPAATAYVDQYGAPAAAPTQPPTYGAPAPKAPSYPAPNPAPQPVPAPQPKPQPYPAPKSPSPAPSYSAPSPSSSSAPSSGSGQDSGIGITYSPYQADNGCKTQDEVNSDFEKIFQSGDYGTVRLYGTNCDQTAKVLTAISKAGKKTKVMAGIEKLDDVAAEAKLISDAVTAAGGNWKDLIDSVSVGNELVNSGAATPAQVSAAVSQAKSALPNAPAVITVDTFVAIIAHPEMCDIGDYIGANCHAFFDGGVDAAGAGKFVLDQAQRVSSVCGGKKVVITETGWPNQGNNNKVAVPSMQNQATAISSLKSAFSSNMFLFTAFNDMWKKNSASTFGCEQYWGIIN